MEVALLLDYHSLEQPMVKGTRVTKAINMQRFSYLTAKRSTHRVTTVAKLHTYLWFCLLFSWDWCA